MQIAFTMIDDLFVLSLHHRYTHLGEQSDASSLRKKEVSDESNEYSR
jgi:hypothetical protein